MNKALQQQVIQQANLHLATIRYIEINYFTGFFGRFGTQCMMLAVSICTSIGVDAQFPMTALHNGFTVNYFFVMLYNIMAALCIGLATMSMLASVFISVYGEGKALHGPAGSIAATINCMVQEQHRAVCLFCGTVASFVLHMVGMSWIMMDEKHAIVATILMLLGSAYTYRIALRIYNRFYWDSDPLKSWKDDIDQVMEVNALTPSIDELKDQYGEDMVASAERESFGRGFITGRESDSERRGVLGNILKILTKGSSKKRSKSVRTSVDSSSVAASSTKSLSMPSHQLEDLLVDLRIDIPTSAVWNGSDNIDGQVKAFTGTGSSPNGGVAVDTTAVKARGYLTLKTGRHSLVLRNPWKRRYLVIQGRSIFYYKDKRSFVTNPGKPVNLRPIDLEGFSLLASENQLPFLLTLIPTDEADIRINWQFRADTLEEFRSWKDIFTKALLEAHGGSLAPPATSFPPTAPATA